jgi:hypothetical protein
MNDESFAIAFILKTAFLEKEVATLIAEVLIFSFLATEDSFLSLLHEYFLIFLAKILI